MVMLLSTHADNNEHRAIQSLLPEEFPPLSTVEGRYVARVLSHRGGNKQAAARVLEVDRKTLDRMIKRHRIDSRKVIGLRPRDNSAQLPSDERQKNSA